MFHYSTIYLLTYRNGLYLHLCQGWLSGGGGGGGGGGVIGRGFRFRFTRFI